MHNPLFINTVLMGGSSQAKIAAATGAGFDQIELWRQDVDAMPRGAAGIVQALGNIVPTDFQVLMDVDGAPGAKRNVKREEAVRMLDMAMQLDAGTLLVPASTDPDCDPARVVDDLVWLAQEAAARRLRIAYEGMGWSTINHTTPSASDINGIPAERILSASKYSTTP